MRISDWSSDVCSSDLDEEVRHCRATLLGDGGRRLLAALPRLRIDLGAGTDLLEALDHYELAGPEALLDDPAVASDVARLHRAQLDRPVGADDIELRRSEERRVGKECVSTCRSRWAPYPSKKKK